MDDLLGFLFVIIAVVSAISKQAAKNKANTGKRTPYQQANRPSAPKPAAPARPAPQQISMASMLPPREGAAPAQHASPAPAQPFAAPLQPAQPMVHTHLEPDCETHDASGSLAFLSTEGKDACHEDQLSDMRSAPTAMQEARPGLSLDWSGDSMVKAFVMQEVLTRPAQRQMRR